MRTAGSYNARVGETRSVQAGPLDSVAIPRFLLAVAAAGGIDQRQLARQAGLPGWTLAATPAMVGPGHALRLWELLEHALGDPHYALRAAGMHQLGQMDIFDYLFMTSGTLGEGMLASIRHLPLLTTNGVLRVEATSDGETTYSYGLRHAQESRGGELALHTAVAAWCMRARAATGRQLAPVHVAFAHPAPRSHRAFTETFGTRQIDFGAPLTTFTFRNSDLGIPLNSADPVLSRILRSYADILAPPRAATWLDHFRRVLDKELERGSPPLPSVARRLALSPRTLQRRLAEHSTSWRAELDRARQRRVGQSSHHPDANLGRLARQMGYVSPRSARRALDRWAGLDEAALSEAALREPPGRR
jgi:AraC-like DNA-binding protein